MAVNFNLNGNSIQAVWNHKGKRIKYSTGFSLDGAKWDAGKQRLKPNSAPAIKTNQRLTELEARMNDLILSYEKSGVFPDAKQFKSDIQGQNNGVLLYEAMEEYIRYKEVLYPDAAKQIGWLRDRLRAFEKTFKPLHWDIFDQIFYDRFISHLHSLHYTLNSEGKFIKNLKSFLHWAIEQEYFSDTRFTKYKVTKEEVDFCFLTKEELDALFNFDFKSDPELKEVRDAWCWMAASGMRISDYEQMDNLEIQADQVLIKTRKNDKRLGIPLNRYTREILNRNGGKVPMVERNRINERIKTACDKADIHSEVIFVTTKGGKEHIQRGPKYKFVTNHTAKRTFVTLSLMANMTELSVLAITGNKDSKSLRPYKKIADQHKIEQMKLGWG